MKNRIITAALAFAILAGGLALRPAPAEDTPPAAPPVRWEYKVVSAYEWIIMPQQAAAREAAALGRDPVLNEIFDRVGGRVETNMIALGADGWELVSVTETLIYFKRPAR